MTKVFDMPRALVVCRPMILGLAVFTAHVLISCVLVVTPVTAQDSESVRVNSKITLDSAEVQIPMDHSSQHIVISTKVNGQGPFRFQLDTGAGLEACVDLKLAEKLDMPTIGNVLNSSGSEDNAVRRDLVRVNEITFGGMKATNVRALAADYSWISTDPDDPVMGILGFELFEDLLLTIDYPRNEIVLRQGDLTAEQGADTLTFDASSGTPHISVTIGGQEIRTMIDTGAKGAIVLTEDQIGRLKINGEMKQTGTGRTVNEEFPIFSATLAEDLVLGTKSFPNVQASIFKSFDYSIVGHQLLSHFVITFDQRNSRVKFATQ